MGLINLLVWIVAIGKAVQRWRRKHPYQAFMRDLKRRASRI